MQVYDLGNPGQAVLITGVNYGYRVLPEDSIVLFNTPMIKPGTPWEYTHSQLKILVDQQIKAKYVFIDASYDPITLSNREIQQHIRTINDYFLESKIVFLSSRVQHWYDEIPNVLYLPYFINLIHRPHTIQPRKGRMGCLNRNNTAHRIWLMHNLLKDKLIDPARDVYSVSFVNRWSPNRCDISTWLGNSKTPYDLEYDLSQWPDTIATHPDDFPNDFSTDHPAWNTGIAIITETESGYRTMLTEKTWKAIRSHSCWTAYMAEEGYTFLEDIGFEPRFFKKHASFDNIAPIVNLCKTIDTEAAALDYYHSQTDKIKHNFEWSGGDDTDSWHNLTTPWHQRFLPKFRRQLESL